MGKVLAAQRAEMGAEVENEARDSKSAFAVRKGQLKTMSTTCAMVRYCS